MEEATDNFFFSPLGGSCGGVFKSPNFAMNSCLCVSAASVSCSFANVSRRNFSSSGRSLLIAEKDEKNLERSKNHFRRNNTSFLITNQYPINTAG